MAKIGNGFVLYVRAKNKRLAANKDSSAILAARMLLTIFTVVLKMFLSRFLVYLHFLLSLYFYSVVIFCLLPMHLRTTKYGNLY